MDHKGKRNLLVLCIVLIFAVIFSACSSTGYTQSVSYSENTDVAEQVNVQKESYNQPIYSKGDYFQYNEVDDYNLGQSNFYYNNNHYECSQANSILRDSYVEKAWIYIDGVSCVLIENGNVIAVDENNNMIWHGMHTYGTELFNQSVALGNAAALDVQLQTMNDVVDCGMEMYYVNTPFIEETYIEKLYNYNESEAQELILAISNVYGIADQNLASLNKMYNIQKAYNELQRNKVNRW